MATYVDDALHLRWGRKWCHMWADTPEEMHALARRLGLGMPSFQTPPKASWDHYDLTEAKRARALRLGAVDAGRYGAVEFVARSRGDFEKADRIARLRAVRSDASAPRQGELGL